MNSKSLLGAALIFLAIGLTGGGVYTIRSLKMNGIDPETLCPLTGPGSITILMVDKTDPLTAAEQGAVRSVAGQERDSIPRGGRFVVSVLEQTAGTNDTVLDKVADLCNPGAEANPLFENPKRVALRYNSAFIAPVDAAIASFEGMSSAPASPIAAAIEESMADAGNTSGPVKLILISDMMEHTSAASAYTGTLSVEALRRTMPHAFAGRFMTAGIRILLLSRPKYARQQAAAAAIWQRFFKDATGREAEFIRL